MWKSLKWHKNDREGFFRLSASEKRYLLGKTLIVTLTLDYFFYKSFWALLPLCGIGIGYYLMEKRILFQKKKDAAREEFKELMLVTATGQKAGYSAENAFLSSYQDMKGLYGEDSSVCRMLCFLKSGRENNTSFSVLWKQMGNMIDLEEIIEFAQVYEISQKSSGNMAAIMEKTALIKLSYLFFCAAISASTISSPVLPTSCALDVSLNPSLMTASISQVEQ